MRRALISIAAVAALAVATAGTASAKIVEGRSIAGIRLGETPAEVKAHLGGPPDDGSSPSVYHYKDPIQLRLTIFFGRVAGQERAFQILTTSRYQVTSRHIHVGSSESAVKRAYAGDRIRCFANHRRGARQHGTDETCYFSHRGAATEFHLLRKRVADIVVVKLP